MTNAIDNAITRAKRSSVQLTIRIHQDNHAYLQARAKAADVSLNALVAALIEEVIESQIMEKK